RRLARERRAARPEPAPRLEAACQEVSELLDRTLGQLPEKYREVLLLCYWEGHTQEDAARQLGCPLGTVRSRLARGRELLQRRLARRGWPLSAGAFTAALAANTATAAVPVPLLSLTVRAALPSAATAAVPARVASLVAGGVHAMFVTKFKAVGVL